jgi:hypothetical protein
VKFKQSKIIGLYLIGLLVIFTVGGIISYYMSPIEVNPNLERTNSIIGHNLASTESKYCMLIIDEFQDFFIQCFNINNDLIYSFNYTDSEIYNSSMIPNILAVGNDYLIIGIVYLSFGDVIWKFYMINILNDDINELQISTNILYDIRFLPYQNQVFINYFDSNNSLILKNYDITEGQQFQVSVETENYTNLSNLLDPQISENVITFGFNHLNYQYIWEYSIGLGEIADSQIIDTGHVGYHASFSYGEDQFFVYAPPREDGIPTDTIGIWKGDQLVYSTPKLEHNSVTFPYRLTQGFVFEDLYMFGIFTIDNSVSKDNPDPFVGIYSFNLNSHDFQQEIEIGYGEFTNLHKINNRLVYHHYGFDESEIESNIYTYSLESSKDPFDIQNSLFLIFFPSILFTVIYFSYIKKKHLSNNNSKDLYPKPEEI